MNFSLLRILAVIGPASLTLTGCQLVEVSERYGDEVDRIADCQIPLDEFYRPGLDLTRIGLDRNNVQPHPVIYPDSRWMLNAKAQNAPQPTEPQTMPPAAEESPIPPVPGAAQLPTLDTLSFRPIPEVPHSPSRREVSEPSVSNAPAGTLNESNNGTVVSGDSMTVTARQSTSPANHSEQKVAKRQSRPNEIDLPPLPAEIQLTTAKSVSAAVPSPEMVSPIPSVERLGSDVPAFTKEAVEPQLLAPISAPAGVPPSPTFYLRFNKETR